MPTYNPSLLPTAFPTQATNEKFLMLGNGLFFSKIIIIIIGGIFVVLLGVISFCFYRYVRKKRDEEQIIVNTFVNHWNVQKMRNEEKQKNVNVVDGIFCILYLIFTLFFVNKYNISINQF